MTRLLVRSRLRMVPGWALHGAGFLSLGDTVMQRAMLRGIRRWAERATHQQPAARRSFEAIELRWPSGRRARQLRRRRASNHSDPGGARWNA